MKKIGFQLIGLCIVVSMNAQYNPEKINKSTVAVLNQALEKSQNGELPEAITLLEQAVKNEPRYLDAWVLMAAVYGTDKKYAESVAAYEKAFAIDRDYSFEYLLPYSINLAGMGFFDKAVEATNTLLARQNINPNTRKAAEYRKRTYEFAVELGKNETLSNYVFTPRNLGESINTEVSEYFPSLTLDGSELVFTRRIRNMNEDFYSSKQNGMQWNQASALPGEVNTPLNEAAQNISLDGQWLVFAACNRPDSYGGCDLYISYMTPQGWSEAINLGGTVNSDQWDSQPSLSPDKRQLYYTSRRFDGYGGSDLYVSTMQSNGKWGTPVNLGAAINSKGDEASPFIHSDNQTLYFTSNGLPGYGKEDIYLVRRDAGGLWAKPENLGYPINTIETEGTIFIASDGKTAYYASDRADSKGGLDIYSFELREKIRPHRTLWVKGNVFDKKTNKGLPSTVELINLENGHALSRVQTDEFGNYLITLPLGKDYAFNVNRRGYLFFSDNFSLKNRTPDSTYEKNIPLQPIEANAMIVLKNVFFDVNKFELKPESKAELDKVVQLLNENPTLKIQISGHTDNVGKTTDNQVLSENRAKAVRQYLGLNSIHPSRVETKGFGASQPVAPNSTDEGRALNRRTEMKVINP